MRTGDVGRIGGQVKAAGGKSSRPLRPYDFRGFSWLTSRTAPRAALVVKAA